MVDFDEKIKGMFHNKVKFHPKTDVKTALADGKKVYYYTKGPSPQLLDKIYKKIPDSKHIPIVIETKKQYLNEYVNNQEKAMGKDFTPQERREYTNEELNRMKGVVSRYTTKTNKFIDPRVVFFADTKWTPKELKFSAWHEYGHELAEKKPQIMDKYSQNYTPQTAVTRYGATDPEEDFADRIAIDHSKDFRVNPFTRNNPYSNVVNKILGKQLNNDSLGKNMVMFYHGTQKKNIPSIMNLGLLSEQELSKLRHQPVDNANQLISVTSSKRAAGRFGNAIVKVDIPREQLEGPNRILTEVDAGATEPEYYAVGKVPSQYIVGFENLGKLKKDIDGRDRSRRAATYGKKWFKPQPTVPVVYKGLPIFKDMFGGRINRDQFNKVADTYGYDKKYLYFHMRNKGIKIAFPYPGRLGRQEWVRMTTMDPEDLDEEMLRIKKSPQLAELTHEPMTEPIEESAVRATFKPEGLMPIVIKTPERIMRDINAEKTLHMLKEKQKRAMATKIDTELIPEEEEKEVTVVTKPIDYTKRKRLTLEEFAAITQKQLEEKPQSDEQKKDMAIYSSPMEKKGVESKISQYATLAAEARNKGELEKAIGIEKERQQYLDTLTELGLLGNETTVQQPRTEYEQKVKEQEGRKIIAFRGMGTSAVLQALQKYNPQDKDIGITQGELKNKIEDMTDSQFGSAIRQLEKKGVILTSSVKGMAKGPHRVITWNTPRGKEIVISGTPEEQKEIVEASGLPKRFKTSVIGGFKEMVERPQTTNSSSQISEAEAKKIYRHNYYLANKDKFKASVQRFRERQKLDTSKNYIMNIPVEKAWNMRAAWSGPKSMKLNPQSGALKRIKEEILSGKYFPIRVEGKHYFRGLLPDGRHRIIIYKQLGIPYVPVDIISRDRKMKIDTAREYAKRMAEKYYIKDWQFIRKRKLPQAVYDKDKVEFIGLFENEADKFNKPEEDNSKNMTIVNKENFYGDPFNPYSSYYTPYTNQFGLNELSKPIPRNINRQDLPAWERTPTS
jgi:hypothetical protein